MNFILTGLIINIKRIIRGKAFLFIMLLLPAVIFFCSYLAQEKTGIVAVSIGIVWDENDFYAAEIYKNIPMGKGIEFEKFRPDDMDEVENLVKTGRLESAYVINPDAGNKIEAGNIKGIVTLIKSPQTVTEAIINEMVYSSVIKTASAHITANELVKNLGVDYNETKRIISEKTDAYYNYDNSTNFVKSIDSYYEKTGSEQEFDAGAVIAKRILHGLTAMFILTAVIFMLPRFIDEKQNGFAKKLGAPGIYKYYLSLLTAFFLITTAAGALALCIVQAVYPLGLTGMAAEIAMLCAYTFVVSMLGVLFVNLLNKSDMIYSGFIFLLVINMFFGGILFDLKEISPSAGNFSDYFVTSRYINAAIYGNTGSLAATAVFLLILTAVTALAIKKTAAQK